MHNYRRRQPFLFQKYVPNSLTSLTSFVRVKLLFYLVIEKKKSPKF